MLTKVLNMGAQDVQGSLALVINRAEQKALELNKPTVRDYYKDGVLYCGKCNTPKEHIGSVFGIKKIVPCMCECRLAELAAEKERQAQEKQLERIKELRKVGFPEREMREQTFASDDGADPRVMQAMKKYVDNYSVFREKHKGLLLYGNSGSGKTFAAACVVNALIDKGVECLMTNFGRVFNTLWSTEEKQAYLDGLNKFDMLVLDDLGAERKTEFAQELMFQIIDNRCRSGLPTIITTNLPIDAIKKPQSIMETRIYDRILQMCHPIEVKHVSRRRKKVADEFLEVNKMLGL